MVAGRSNASKGAKKTRRTSDLAQGANYMDIDKLEDPIKTMRDSGYGDPDVMDFPSGGKTRKGSDVLDRMIQLEQVKKKKKKKTRTA
jgi:hypothetical protein